MKKILLAIAAACLFSAAFSVRAEEVSDSSRVIAYLFKMILSPQMMQRIADSSIDPHETELRELTMPALLSFNSDEVAQIFAASSLNTMTAEDLKPCLAFIGTPVARSLQAAGQRSEGETDKLLQELQTLPAQEQEQVVAFFMSPCVQKATAMMQSEQGVAMAREYGEQLMCRHIATHVPDKLEVAHKLGKCL